MTIKFALALTCLTTATFAAAQTQPARLDAARAQAIVEGCKRHAAAKSQSHAIAVVDAGGDAVASLRMDGNRSGIMAFSESKARAVASWGFSTARMAQAASETPGFAQAPHIVTVPGGVPVFSTAGELVGAVGVSGEAPADDVACAEAGIAAAGFVSARPR